MSSHIKKEKKIVVLVLYFGKLPNHFQLWLDSCAYNNKIDFLIFTDDKTKFIYPINVSVKYCSFIWLKNLIQKKYHFKINLNTPYKLCDFRPAYGDIFSEYLKEYDYWGYCDLDMIFGDLYLFLEKAISESYDKIMMLGHLSLYKNIDEINTMYKKINSNYINYKNIFSSANFFGFDEIARYGINSILMKNGKKIYHESIYADIDETSSRMDLVNYDIEKNKFMKKSQEQIFTFENGKIYSNFYKNNKQFKKEYLYIHFQKRKMVLNITRGYGKYFISNTAFLPYEIFHVSQIRKYMKKRALKDIFKIKRSALINLLKKESSILIWRIKYILKI